MNHLVRFFSQITYKKIITIALSVLSIVGYGFFVFAAGPFAPGTELDPACTPYINNDPNQGVDVNCTVTLPGGGSVTATNGLSIIGADVGLGGLLTQATLIDQNGNDFIVTDGFYSFGKVNDISTQTSIPAPAAPFLGAWYSDGAGSDYASGYMNNMGTGMYFTGVQSGQYVNRLGISDNNDGVEVESYDQLNGQFSQARFGTLNISMSNQDSLGLFGSLTIDATNGIQFSSEQGNYYFPKGVGNAGEVLTTDGSGNLSWAVAGGGSTLFQTNTVDNANQSLLNLIAGGNISLTENNGEITIEATGAGFSPFTIENGSSIFSTGLTDTGLNSTATDSFFVGNYAGADAASVAFANFVGYGAGQNATNASYSNFFGEVAGSGATDAAWSNFFGSASGQNATSAGFSNFFGYYAGQDATNANNSNFFGPSAGQNATNANSSNFFGSNAGANASEASSSNFLGPSAGINATNANNSNFFGPGAGANALNAAASNFIGFEAGVQATDAYNSNFLGSYAGEAAANAYQSNFLGQYAGSQAFNAYGSNFIGPNAGQQATNASNSNFFGPSAGLLASGAANSFFAGYQSGYNDIVDNTISNTTDNCDINNGGFECYSILIGNLTSTVGFSNSIAMGAYAANTATNQFMMGSTNRPINELIINGTGSLFLPIGDDSQRTSYASDGAIRYNTMQSCVEVYSGGSWACLGGGGGSGPFSIVNGNSIFSTGLVDTGLNSIGTDSFFVGNYAGQDAINAFGSNFIGSSAGINATNASSSNFIGPGAGSGAINAVESNFFGAAAGFNSVDANRSNFFGFDAGREAVNASESNFFGQSAGSGATNAAGSNFFGTSAGSNAANAVNSSFFGISAGNSATNAANSFFVGVSAGSSDSVDNTINNLTDNCDVTNGGLVCYSILLGSYTNTGGYSNSIAIGAYATNTATNQFMIGSAQRPIDDMTIIGNGFTTCTVDTGTGSGISCSSDERLKTNITDLGSDTLAKLNALRSVTYTWKDRDSGEMIGFLAQNIQEQFPQLVSEGATGYLSVNYAGMTPILTKAIQELDIKITAIESFASSVNTTFIDSVRTWLGDVGNGIEKLFAREITTEKLCINQTCVTESQLQQLLSSQGVQSVSSPGSQQSDSDPIDVVDVVDVVDVSDTTDPEIDSVTSTDPVVEMPSPEVSEDESVSSAPESTTETGGEISEVTIQEPTTESTD